MRRGDGMTAYVEQLKQELAAERQKVAELAGVLRSLTDYTYEAAIPGGDNKLQGLRAHAAATLAKNGGKP